MFASTEIRGRADSSQAVNNRTEHPTRAETNPASPITNCLHPGIHIIPSRAASRCGTATVQNLRPLKTLRDKSAPSVARA